MDKEYFGLAAAEVAGGQIDPALMIKAMALAEGNEAKGRALYITLRAEEIASLHKKAKLVAGAALTTHVVGGAVAATGRVAGAAIVATGSAAGVAINKATTATRNFVKLILKIIFWSFVAIVVVITLVLIIQGLPSQNCAKSEFYNYDTQQCESWPVNTESP